MNRARAALIEEYRQLLRAQGIDHLTQPRVVSSEERALLWDRIRRQGEQAAADYGDKNLLAEHEHLHGPLEEVEDELPERYAGTAERIERAVHALGFELPGPVYVGEYPHQSFNAQACSVRSGTLLLINSGLDYLLVEVALALGTRILIAERDENGSIRPQRATRAMRRRRDHADENLANSLATYVLHTDPMSGGKQQVDTTARGVMSYLAAGAATDFAVAHEYGHFLAGHLNGSGRRRTGTDWLRKSHAQEFEADEIGMLLSLKAQEYDGQLSALSFGKHITVQGAFLFFAVDHLLNRVRDEVVEIGKEKIVSDHPPSDARAAALRRTLTELEGSHVFQLADAYVASLSAQEDKTLDSLRRLMRDARPDGGH
ncbi:hypothetical protein STRAU_5889 [Streptomyces aurantiacus JA 4570]|uniref:Peptidase M48 domain-containing protein n=2 Tax=Streptomyces aurantiacus TaxID=47760 RepID=S3ZRL7_9ACTN|nr:hypothetical protein STRAU_5889 [Streptomyces aurantiacus JA 4570]